jgi:hypothetical protein
VGRCLELIKAEGEGIFLTGGEGCPRVFAEGCDASKDPY